MTSRIVTDTQLVTVPLGKAGSIEVNLHQLTDATYEWVFAYGLRQLLNDAHASEKEPEAKRALSAKRLERLYEGNLRQGRGPSASADPVGREAARLAKAAIKAWGEPACAAKRAKLGLDETAFLAKVVEHFRPQAEATLRAMSEIQVEI